MEIDLLLVDDSQADVKLTLHAITQQSPEHRVAVVRDGEEALDFLFVRGRYSDRLSCSAPRLILLDLKLPKVNGFEVLKAVKGDDRTRSIPVVMLTSSKQESDVVRSYRLGANSYVQKPVDFDTFRTLVQQIERYWLAVNISAPAPVSA